MQRRQLMTDGENNNIVIILQFVQISALLERHMVSFTMFAR